MSVSNLFKEYLNPSPMVRVSDILWIPYTRVGFHAIELDGKTLFTKGENFVCKVRKNVDFLKTLKLNNPTGIQNVYKLIQTWNDYVMTGVPRSYNVHEFNFLGRVEDRFFKSVLYDDIFRGKYRKRSFRLHFNLTRIPITLAFDGKIESYDILLNCISEGNILFEVPAFLRDKIESSSMLEIHLSTETLFECHNDEVAERFYNLKTDPSAEEIRKAKIMGYIVDKRNITFHKNTFEELIWETKGSYFMCIPIASLEEPFTRVKADFDKLISRTIGQFHDDVEEVLESA